MNKWESEEQFRDMEEFEQRCQDFYTRWSPKMNPEDAELCRRAMCPWVKPESNPSGVLFAEMACGDYT